MRARSLTLTLTCLLIAVPLTVGVWGTFWLSDSTGEILYGRVG
jgi:hypothetical protein